MGKDSKHHKRKRSRSRSGNDDDKNRRKRKSPSPKSHHKHKKSHNNPPSGQPSSSSKELKKDKPNVSSEQLVDFSFTDYKGDFNRLIFADNDDDKLVLDVNDFWQFLNKYESVLKKNKKPVLQPSVKDEDKLNGAGLPIVHNKLYCVNISLKSTVDDLYSRIPPYDEDYDYKKRRLTRDIISQFVDVLLLYMDFKNKEKFNVLKKLRKAQSELPVAEYKDKIIETVKNERVVIIAGDTGCGKSTQVPQYLSEAGFNSIACTQPRRIACISLAKRVSYENMCKYGTDVGYQIRFEKNRNQGTKICFITEGLLLRQVASESSLSNYDVIILDEIHERHLHGDFLLGILKCLIQTRHDLKLVLMSATINIKLFEDYFSNESAVVIEVPGRLYPIELFYRPMAEGRTSKHERLDAQPYLQIMQIIDTKYPKTEKGDLLIFLSGLQEITSVVDAANQYAEKSQGWIVLPLHSSLSIADQDKVFDYPPDGVRKCIVSTNIAETSVTIDGIRFVVDSGKVKEMSYDPSSKMQRLKEFWIPKSSAEQRKGRAGRTGPGVCYRIYSEKEYASLESFGTPELLRVPLDSLLLLMISLGLNDVRKFPFLDAPQPESVENSLLELKQHYAVTSNERMTPLGKALSKLPVEIVLGKMLVLGSVLLQSETALSLAAALSVQSPYTNRAHRDIDCETARKPLQSDHGDPLTLLNTYAAWLEVKQESSLSKSYDKNKDKPRSGGSRQWCKKRGLEEQRFYEVTKLRTQFKDLLQDCGLLEAAQPESMSSADRALRHGQLKQLKDMRRKHRNQSAEDSRKRKRLKMQMWELEDEFNEGNTDPNTIDIKDVEFRLDNDMRKVQDLISGSSATSHRDMSTLKLILCRALYPQVAVADEFNHCKSVSEQLFHTSSKAFVSLHPMSVFGNHPQVLQLEENNIESSVPGFKSKLPISSKHQIICYLSLLETTKPYLMNSMRMPAAQTLLLFAHCIDTNMAFSRLVCDSWLQLEFPTPETGLQLLLKASKLRKQWDSLINDRLGAVEVSVESSLEKSKSKPKSTSNQQLQYELSINLASYMATEVSYTIKRLLPADLKLLYNSLEDDVIYPDVNPNPFDEDFKCTVHDKKGGVWLTDHIVFGSLVENDWSDEIYQQISQTPWICNQCDMTMCLPPLEKMQHKFFTCLKSPKNAQSNADDNVEDKVKSSNPNAKEYNCAKCKKKLFLTPVEVLKHKKNCSV
ncbi:putative ATP-dependent RNA helicase DHX34 [Arctopsyche grandis]|uniref:putative ATP-dependent RNA helicase DHX34 n=1 Tax=Arctopsyche grandis TaxID=121162 RepID=UPI00406D923B